MNILSIAAGAALFTCSMAGLTQSAVPCGQTLAAPLNPNAALAITSIPAAVEIVGTDESTIHVSCSADGSDEVRQIQLQLTGTPTGSRLKVTGPHLNHGNLKVRIEVPRKTNLEFEMAAGDLKIGDVVGDKDLTLRAGAMTISSTHPQIYKDVTASVTIGEVTVSPDGESKGGFFRTFHKQNANGQYRLHAHITTGQIILIGINSRNATAAE